MVETINDELKNIRVTGHSRQWPIDNSTADLTVGHVVCNLLLKKPPLNSDFIDIAIVIV